MAIRNPRSWDELSQTLRELFSFKEIWTSQNPDFAGRRITNAGHSVDLDDYVIRRELIDTFGAAISQPPSIQRGATLTALKGYEKITFGIGVGGSVGVGTDLTPPYIWSNSSAGRPEIILVAANTPPRGDDLDLDVKRNGSTIFKTGKFTLPDSTGPKVIISSTSAFQSGLTFQRYNIFSIDVTKIGLTIPGQMITVVVFCKLI